MFLSGVRVISFVWRDCSRDVTKACRGLEMAKNVDLLGVGGSEG